MNPPPKRKERAEPQRVTPLPTGPSGGHPPDAAFAPHTVFNNGGSTLDGLDGDAFTRFTAKGGMLDRLANKYAPGEEADHQAAMDADLRDDDTESEEDLGSQGEYSDGVYLSDLEDCAEHEYDNFDEVAGKQTVKWMRERQQTAIRKVPPPAGLLSLLYLSVHEI
jgi:hypothetical protein